MNQYASPHAFRALIAEDEPVLAQALQTALGRLWPELSVCAVAVNGVQAVEQALAKRPDVLFLDIKMPGKTGLEAAQEIAEDWANDTAFPLVVFVTAYDEYALAAFEQAAADYVLKPVGDERLGKTVERLKARLARTQDRAGDLDRIVEQLRALSAPAAGAAATPALAAGERLTVIRAAIGNQVRLIPIEDVVYFEAADKYVNVVTADSESLIRTPLKELLDQLDPARFSQIHRGTVVNMRQVQAAVRDDTGKLFLRLRNRAEKLPVSRLFAHLFRQM